MPNVKGFLARHAVRARDDGVLAATRSATKRAATWGASRALERIHGQGDLIWDEEWDVCVIADATRWDQWQAISPEYDWLHDASGWAVGSCSPEWYGNTFDPGTLADVPVERVGVVSANPFAGKHNRRMPELLGDATPLDRHDFAVVDNVFDDEWGTTVDGEYLDVVDPAVVTDRAWRAWREYDLDRLVVHYMQPHLPFRSRPEWFGRRGNLKHFGEDAGEAGQPYDGPGKSIWKRLRDGQVSRDAVWDAYCDNLRWALDEIDRLRRALDGDLLITADHGNAMGEWGVWSHPPGMMVPALRRVPWVHVDGLGGKFVGSGASGVRDASIEEQLDALGYR